VVNTGFERGGENRIVVTLFDGNNDEGIPLPNAGIFWYDIYNFELFVCEEFLPVGIGQQNNDKPLGAFNIRVVLALIVMKSGI